MNTRTNDSSLTMNHLDEEHAVRGTVGIPQGTEYVRKLSVLGIPSFTELRISVWCSLRSPARKIYELGIESIPSESECYPAKLAHGHVSWLIKQGLDYIFYPCIPYERM